MKCLKKNTLLRTFTTALSACFFVLIFFTSVSYASPEYIVRIIYFVPSDRTPQKDIDTQLDKLIKEAQQFCADLMESHGFDRKTFRLETDATGKVVVHHVNGKFNDAYYQSPSTSVAWREINEQFDMSKNIYLTAIDISSEVLSGKACGRGSGGSHNGRVLMPASGRCFHLGLMNHELGHAFGLKHDFRPRTTPPSFTFTDNEPMLTSFCAAEWWDAHRYFNPTQIAFDEPTMVEMFSPSPASSPYAIRLQFEISDLDGLHQAQLVNASGLLIDYKRLNGKSNTVEFVVTTYIASLIKSFVTLRVMDVHGNIRNQRFPIDITSLLPPSEVVSIPDLNLAAAVRETLGLTPGGTITQLDMLRFGIVNDKRSFNASGRQITDLTGLKYTMNTLRTLVIRHNQISDVSPLEELVNLENLNLVSNQITDVSPLAKLTNLRILDLKNNQITDVSPLAGLVNLQFLWLRGNPIADMSPLHKLLRQNSNLKIDIDIGDVPPTPDFDGDGIVGVPDFLLFVEQFGLSRGDVGYNTRYDLDGDGTIGVSDFLIFMDAFGKEGTG